MSTITWPITSFTSLFSPIVSFNFVSFTMCQIVVINFVAFRCQRERFAERKKIKSSASKPVVFIADGAWNHSCFDDFVCILHQPKLYLAVKQSQKKMSENVIKMSAICCRHAECGHAKRLLRLKKRIYFICTRRRVPFFRCEIWSFNEHN